MHNRLIIERIATVFILASVALAVLVSPWWLLFTAFVALNLFQSTFTGFCPVERLLAKTGAFGYKVEGSHTPMARPARS